MYHPWRIICLLAACHCYAHAHSPSAHSPPYSILIDDPTVCDVGIIIPEDTHLCEPGEIDLIGELDGNYEYVWCENGYDTSYDLVDEADVRQATTFTLKASFVSEENLVVNGDFESGESGFTTDYTPGLGNCNHFAGFLGCEGFYNVLDDPSVSHINWSACSGGPISGGNMMVVNGASALQEIWCQEICVDPEGTYMFSAYGASVHPASPAQLQWSVDGTLIGDLFDLPSSTCDWQLFEAVWEASGETSIEICVTNQNTAAGGNDFALDDIGLYRVCTDEKSFEVTVSDFELDYIEPEIFTCQVEEVEVTIDVFPIGDYDYLWETTDGNILYDENDSATILVDQGGEYYVTVTDMYGCTREEVIEVEEDRELPEFEIAPIDTLDCTQDFTVVTLEYDNRDLEFLWYDMQDELISSEDSHEINEGGEYYVIAIDEDSGCESTIDFVVPVDTIRPSFILEKSGDLDCQNNAVFLQVFNTVDDVIWDAHPSLNPISTDLAEARAPDTYYITVIGENGCSDRDSITVGYTEPDFLYQAQGDTLIDCNFPMANVEVTLDTSVFDLKWLNLGSVGNDALTVEIDQGGTYYYEITDTLGCSMMDSVMIQENFALPESVDVDAETIRCDNQTATITVDNPNDYTIAWMHENGATGTGDTYETSDPGNLSYTIVADNGCEITETITVETEGDFPEITIEGGVIDCITAEVELSYTSNQALQSAEWILPNSSLSTEPTITVDQEGIYVLAATNLQGCEVVSSYIVAVDTIAPDFVLPDLGPITCDTPTVSTLVDIPADYAEIIYAGDWFDESTNEVFFSEPGTYDMTIVGTNGCRTTDAITIGIDTLVPDYTVIGDSLLTCDNPSVLLVLDVHSDYQRIAWTIPFSAQVHTIDTIEVNEPFVYAVSVIGDNGCERSTTIEVTEDMTPPEYSITATDITCAEELSTITVSSNEELRSIEYYVDGSLMGSGEVIETDVLTPISVVVTGTNGCESSQNILVVEDLTSFDFTAVVDPINCNNRDDGVIIDIVEDVEYISSVITNVVSGTSIGDVETPITEPSLYNVELIINAVCTSSVMVEVLFDFDEIDFQVEDVELDCEGTPADIFLSVSSPFTEAIVTDDSGLAIGDETTMIDATGTYSMTLIGDNGCSSTREFDVTQVEGIQAVDVRLDIPDCQEARELYLLEIEGGNPAFEIYLDDVRLIDPQYPLLVEGVGTHTVSVVDSEGCRHDTQFVIEAVDPVETQIIPEVEIMAGETIELNLTLNQDIADIESIEWIPQQNLSCYDCLNPIFSGTESMDYQVYVTDKNGCEAFTEIRVIVNQIIRYYIPNVFTYKDTAPNGSFTIFSEDIEDIQFLNIYDRWGNLVFVRENFAASDSELGWDGTLNDKPVELGVYVYFAQLKLTDGTVEKVVGDVTFVR